MRAKERERGGGGGKGRRWEEGWVGRVEEGGESNVGKEGGGRRERGRWSKGGGREEGRRRRKEGGKERGVILPAVFGCKKNLAPDFQLQGKKNQ